MGGQEDAAGAGETVPPEVSSVKPKVSVMMLAYNHEAYIEQAVVSAATQVTDFPFEVVIGEDCSTDGTRDILLRLRDEYPDRIRLLFREANLGMHRNFMETLAEVRGEYVAALEGDDYWTDEHKLSKQCAVLDANPECAISFHDVSVLKAGVLTPQDYTGPRTTGLKELLEQNYVFTASVMYRHSMLKPFPEWMFTQTYLDWLMWLLLGEAGTLIHLPERMAVYRVHGAGAFSGRSISQIIEEHNRTIDFYPILNRHFEYRYDASVRRGISRRHFLLAHLYAETGDYAKARRALRKMFSVAPLGASLRARDSLVTTMRVIAPGLYARAKRVMRWLARR